MEVIVHNIDDFKRLVPYATYSSNITHVIEIPDYKLSEVPQECLDILTKHFSHDYDMVDTRPKIIAIKGKLYIQDIGDDLKTYLDLPMNGEIKANSWIKVLELIDLFNISDEAKIYFTPIDENSDISNLYCSNFAMNYKHKRISLEKLVKTVGDLKFNTREISIKKYKVYKNLEIEKVIDNSVFCKNNKELRFFFLSFQQKAAFQPSKIISVMTDKVYKKGQLLFSPEIVPNDFTDFYEHIEVKSNKRDIPIKLLKMAYIEYFVRNK